MLFRSGVGRGGVDRPSSQTISHTEIRRQPPRPVDQPRPGFYLVRMVPRGPRCAARIFHEGGLWWAELNGLIMGEPDADPLRAAGVQKVYLGRIVSETEFNRALEKAADPKHPCSRPYEAVDLSTLPPAI